MKMIWKDFSVISGLVLFFDLIWIQLVMKQKYVDLIPKIQRMPMKVKYVPALISYLTIVLPILLFSIPNVRGSQRLTDSLFFGGLLGLCMYGMFSFTNYALIENWTLEVVVLDTLWGGFLYTLVTYLGSFIIK
jgi:uncharacterized membrane protein